MTSQRSQIFDKDYKLFDFSSRMKGVHRMPTIQDYKSTNLDWHSLWVETIKGFGMKACICATQQQETSLIPTTNKIIRFESIALVSFYSIILS